MATNNDDHSGVRVSPSSGARDSCARQTRRDLLRATGAFGIGSALSAAGCSLGIAASPQAPQGERQVPTRPFGRTGVRVSSLALGGYFDALAHQDLLARAIDLGVTYWETTLSFGGKGYGEYFRHHPGDRDKVFLMAKTQGAPLAQMDRPAALAQMDEDLSTALTEMGTDRIDFFIIGAIRDGSLLNDEVRRWVDGVKAAGKVRFFGFSTHANMEDCLLLASELGFIDGAMTAYNYRLMQLPRMQRAVAACAQRGIALTAIKSQGLDTNPEATLGQETPEARRALHRVLSAGGSEYQARLRAIWDNQAICSICSMMTSAEALLANAEASCQPSGTNEIMSQLLPGGARSPEGRYCTACASVCEGSVPEPAPIADVMRLLMYAHSYGDCERARNEFAKLGVAAKQMLAARDYALAEERCPQRLPIAQLMDRALRELG